MSLSSLWSLSSQLIELIGIIEFIKLSGVIAVLYFFPVNFKSARELHFLDDVHVYFFGSRALFGESSRARGFVHGHFFRRFHGHFSVRSRALFWKFSRALFAVHGHFFTKSTKKTQNFDVHGQFS